MARHNQSQNVGSGEFFGGEITADYLVRDDFSLGGNLTIEHRHIYAPEILNFQPIGVPDVKMFLFAGYRPLQSRAHAYAKSGTGRESLDRHGCDDADLLSHRRLHGR